MVKYGFMKIEVVSCFPALYFYSLLVIKNHSSQNIMQLNTDT